MTTLPTSETASPLRRALAVWYAVLGGVGAWTVHLVFLASFVRFTCNAGGWVWVMHLATALTAAATVLAIFLASRLARASGEEGEDASTPAGRLRFLGQLGMLVGAINLLLILAEGAYVIVVPACRA